MVTWGMVFFLLIMAGGGGSSYYYNLTNDMQGCKPVCIIFGIRPSSEPLLVAEKLLVTNNVLTQLSSSSVEVVIKNITDTSFEGHLNLVSCDKNNFKRNVISKNVNISLASGEESSLIIPMKCRLIYLLAKDMWK